jgi:hypothetical protein
MKPPTVAKFKCKGAAGQACTEEVTYIWKPVCGLSATNKDGAVDYPLDVYLTCDLGHTNCYRVESAGNANV